jgi:aminocarboxymuconate-semialdehyde decarboxylase
MHAHFYGEALFRLLEKRTDVPRVERDAGRRFMVTPTSRFELQGGFVSVRDRLAYMDLYGIGLQLMTFPGALGPDVFPAAEAIPLVRDVNDELAESCASYPERFVGLAGLPWADTDACIAELERCAKIGLIGFILPSNYAASLARLEALAPVLAAADRLGAHVMLHLASKTYGDLGIHRASTIDLHNGIAHALLTLIHAELPARYSNLTFQVVNLGGSFPVLVERMDHIIATRDPLGRRPSAMLADIWVDNASLGPRALELAVAVFGPDKVLLGTDYPIFATRVSIDAVSAAAIPANAREYIRHANAAGLLARLRWPRRAASG